MKKFDFVVTTNTNRKTTVVGYTAQQIEKFRTLNAGKIASIEVVDEYELDDSSYNSIAVVTGCE